MQSDQIEKNEKDPRKLSLLIVYQVLEKGAYTNITLDRYLRTASLLPDDRHLVTEIVNGTVRMLKHLDWVLNLFLRKPIETQNPWLRNVLRISLYQMLFMEKIPDYACVNSAVKLIRDKLGSKLSGVGNGVLRNIARNRASLQYPDQADIIKYLAVYNSQPEWLVQKWVAEYDFPVVQNMLTYFNQRPGLVLRNNDLLGSRNELIEALIQEGVHCLASPRTPWGVLIEGMDRSLEELRAYREGRFYVQNEASMLAVCILNPGMGEHIVDLCSGVGGKTTFMAELMNNIGQIDAYEIYQHKIDLLRTNSTRLHVSIINGHHQDIMAIPTGTELAQGVLLDVPCSGLGVLNRRADSRWRKNSEDIINLTGLQAKFMEQAGQLVAPGGRLVYSTCTINSSENEDIVAEFLRNNPVFFLEGFAGEIEFFPLDEEDKRCAATGMLTIIPGKYRTDGMFYARIRRNKG